MAAGTRLRVDRVKWPDRPHSRTDGDLLGTDEHGTWIGVGDDELLCVPGDRWWAASWYTRAVGYAVDVTAPARWFDGGVALVGLDLRIIVTDEEVQLIGADEFEENRLLYEYPSSVVDAARRSAEDVLVAVTAGDPPFGWAIADGWYAILRAVRGSAP